MSIFTSDTHKVLKYQGDKVRIAVLKTQVQILNAISDALDNDADRHGKLYSVLASADNLPRARARQCDTDGTAFQPIVEAFDIMRIGNGDEIGDVIDLLDLHRNDYARFTNKGACPRTMSTSDISRALSAIAADRVAQIMQLERSH